MKWALFWMADNGISRRKILKFLDETYLTWQKTRFGKNSEIYKRERKRVHGMSYLELVNLLDKVLVEIYMPKYISN